MEKAIGSLLLICYILWRWAFNFGIRFYVCLPFLMIILLLVVSMIGIKFIPRVTEILADTDNFLSEYFAINPIKFSSVQFLREIWNPPSYSYSFDLDLESRKVSTQDPIVETPIEPPTGIDALKSRIQNIADNPGA